MRSYSLGVALAAILLAPASAAWGQEPSRQSIEIAAVGRQTANETYYAPTPAGSRLVYVEQLFGGGLAGYSFALSPRLAIEARAGYLFGRQPQTSQNGGEETLAHLGLRVTQPIGHSRFALRGRIAPGIASFSSGVRSQTVTYDFSNGIGIPTSIPHYGRITDFSLEAGVGVSARLSKRTFLNFDVSHETLLDGDRSQGIPDLGPIPQVLEKAYIEDHAMVTVGLSRSFGRAFQAETPRPATERGPALRNELVISYVLQPTIELYQNNLRNESGFAITGSHFLKPWLALDSSILYLPQGDVPDFQDGGSQLQFFSGVKVGLQRERYGVFAKFRPGLISISHTTIQEGSVSSATAPAVIADDFGGDLGAVVELYPVRRLVVRFDLGETLIRYAGVNDYYPGFPGLAPPGSNYHPPIDSAAGQFLVGVGWRF